MPLTLIALSKVDDKDAGLVSSLVNTGRMVGGSIGLSSPPDVSASRSRTVVLPHPGGTATSTTR
jgi:hypothetical protein